MKTWFASLKGAITLSAIALLSLLAAVYRYSYILIEDYDHLGNSFAVVWVLGYTAIVGGWIWALVAAARGSQRALVALLAYALLTGLGFGAASLTLLTSVPTEAFIFSASLGTGILSTVSVGFQLWDRMVDMGR